MVQASVAVTGSRGFRRGEEQKARDIIESALRTLKVHPSQFITGCAWGADTVAAYIGYEVWSTKTTHVLCVPADTHNYDLVADLRTRPSVVVDEVEQPKNKRVTAYAARNERMLDLAELLVAFPSTHTEVNRSGTWATVRSARRRKTPILFYPLDGAKGWVE